VHEEPDSYVQEDLELDVLALRGEPLERAPAWLAVLWKQAEEALTAIAVRNRRSNP